MKFIQTNIEGVYLVENEPFQDERGIFYRVYCKDEFTKSMFDKEFVQVNHSLTFKKGTIRGLHLQLAPKQEAKLVKCIKGKIFDVIVDMRKDSPTYLQWISFELSSDNRNAVLIPEGCAHGFQTIVDDCEILYFHSEFYSPESERTIYFGNEQLKINWPLKVTCISDKDNFGLRDINDLGVRN